ncbi:MAG: hypothetical protein ABSD78_19875 [Acidimicrobiales bacterium]|jgi:hypothetical protein
MPRRDPLYGNPHTYPEWPQQAVGVAFVPTWATRQLTEPGGAWSPTAGWLDVPIKTIEDEVRTELLRSTRKCHDGRGIIVVLHRLLSHVDMCDMPEGHRLDCDCLHVPPGWTALTVRISPDRILFISFEALNGDLASGIADAQRDPFMHVWPTAPFFVVDHLRAEDVGIYMTGSNDTDPVAVRQWWDTWHAPVLALVAAPEVPPPAGSLFSDSAVPIPPLIRRPSPTAVTTAARHLRRWVEGEDAYDGLPPGGNLEALVAAAAAWALAAAMASPWFPDDVSELLTEADLACAYDMVPAERVLRQAITTGDFSEAVAEAWNTGDPIETANSLTAFAHGLADIAASDSGATMRAVTSGWAELVYDQGLLNSHLAAVINRSPE